jgi:hypothetical protein
MKKLFILASSGILFTISGCSGNSEKAAAPGVPTVAQTPDASASVSSVAVPAAALPVPSVQRASRQGWLSENVKDDFGSVAALKSTSLDGKFDLVILQRGNHSFLSFVRHTRWQAVHNQPAKGKLMTLRVKFEDGEEKRTEWDELGFATENLYSVLWSYPVKTDAPIGPVAEGAKGEAVGGDQLLVQDMMKHKTMFLEVEPGVTTQFDMTGLADKMEKVRTSKAQPVLEARQTGE